MTVPPLDLSRFEKEQYCYLTTRGRITGNPHEIEIWFVLHDNAVFLMSGGRDLSDWVRNLVREPKVTLRIAGKNFQAEAYVEREQEALLIRNQMADKYGERESDGSLSEWARTALVVRITPAEQLID